MGFLCLYDDITEALGHKIEPLVKYDEEKIKVSRFIAGRLYDDIAEMIYDNCYSEEDMDPRIAEIWQTDGPLVDDALPDMSVKILPGFFIAEKEKEE